MVGLSRECNYVELSFVSQLQGLGWDYLQGDLFVPNNTERENFQEVLLLDRLRRAIRRINLDDAARPWLDEQRVNQVAVELQRMAGGAGSGQLMEVNQRVTDVLLNGTTVEGDPDRHVVLYDLDMDMFGSEEDEQVIEANITGDETSI